MTWFLFAEIPGDGTVCKEKLPLVTDMLNRCAEQLSEDKKALVVKCSDTLANPNETTLKHNNVPFSSLFYAYIEPHWLYFAALQKIIMQTLLTAYSLAHNCLCFANSCIKFFTANFTVLNWLTGYLLPNNTFYIF